MKKKKPAARDRSSAGEQALRRTIQRLRAELEQSAHQASFPRLNPMPVCEVGPDGRITYMNAALHRLFPDLTGRSTKHPWIAGIKAAVLPQFQAGKKLVRREVGVGGRWYEQAIYHIARIKSFRIYGQDITEQKAAADLARLKHQELKAANRELRAANERLRASEQSMQAANQELTALNQELQASDEEIKAANQELMATEEELRATNQAIAASEAALRVSETRYRRLFETAKDGILILNAETGMIEDANPFIEDLLDYRREELLGKELWQIGLFRDIVASRDSFQQLQQREYVRYEDLPLQTKTGRRREVEFISNVYPVGDRKVVQCNIRDITERKLAELALRENEEKYRALFDNMIDGVALHRVVYDGEGAATDYVIKGVNRPSRRSPA